MANKPYTPQQIEAMKKALREPYRIYKPLFLDPNNLKRDLDREFESVSQALVWVTKELDAIKTRLDALEAYNVAHP